MKAPASLRQQLRARAESEQAAVLKRLRASPFFKGLNKAERAQVIAESSAGRRFHMLDQVRRERERRRLKVASDAAPGQTWLRKAMALADLTEELVSRGYPIGSSLIPGDRFKALRAALDGVKRATDANKERGKASLERANAVALELLKRNPHLSRSRSALASAVAPQIGLKKEHTEDLLARLSLPKAPRKK